MGCLGWVRGEEEGWLNEGRGAEGQSGKGGERVWGEGGMLRMLSSVGSSPTRSLHLADSVFPKHTAFTYKYCAACIKEASDINMSSSLISTNPKHLILKRRFT